MYYLLSLSPCFAWTPIFPQTKNHAELTMNKIIELIENIVGHLEYYLERSISLWMIIFLIYLLIVIITGGYNAE